MEHSHDDGDGASGPQAGQPSVASLPVPGHALVEPTNKGAERKAQRARTRQGGIATAVDAREQQPSLGSLNRHLATVMQQLTAAHQIVGRVVAERDALRQQLADLQGIPVEDVPIPKIGASTTATTDVTEPRAKAAPARTRLARLTSFVRRPRPRG